MERVLGTITNVTVNHNDKDKLYALLHIETSDSFCDYLFYITNGAHMYQLSALMERLRVDWIYELINNPIIICIENNMIHGLGSSDGIIYLPPKPLLNKKRDCKKTSTFINL